VAGFNFRIEQPTGDETHLWRSDAAPTSVKLRGFSHPQNANGDSVLVGFSITGDGGPEFERFYERNRDKFSALLIIEPEDGPGGSSIKSAGDAVALASHAKELIRQYRAQYGATSLHIVPYAPATFCLFLGQKLNALGRIVTYERTADGDYQESLTILTG
jgi:hypothetical protein